MFDLLQERVSAIFDKITGRGILGEAEISSAMREIQRALLEADVALSVVRDFVDTVKEKALGQEVIKSVTSAQMVIKIVHDALVDLLGAEFSDLDLRASPPVVLLMCGLQGSGKTTTTAKIAHRLKVNDKKRVLMASLDTQRPAAQDQLRVLGENNGIDTLPIVSGQGVLEILERALNQAKSQSYDVLILDTAGRLHISSLLMEELQEIKAQANPRETLLVVDSLTGQDAVRIAQDFDTQIGVTKMILTRIDGDGRGGAALSMRAITGKPIVFLGTGEKIEEIEPFHAERIAGRILGMGDVVSLVEKASRAIDEQKAQKIAERMQKGIFTLSDLAEQLKQLQNLGGMSKVLSFLPGVGQLKNKPQISQFDEKTLKYQLAMISSMTPKERAYPKILNASRKKRIARGAGTEVHELNRLLKLHLQMSDMMKKMGANKGLFGRMFGKKGGGAPDMHQLAEEVKGLDPRVLPKEIKNMLPSSFGKPPFSQGGAPKGGALLPGLGGEDKRFFFSHKKGKK